jgi:hypothetical protein
MSMVGGNNCVQKPMIGLPIDSSFSFRSSIRIVISLSASSC